VIFLGWLKRVGKIMSLQDPIADMLTRVRNGQARFKREVSMPSSKIKVAIASTMKDEGYIVDFNVSELGTKRILSIELKYYEGRAVIESLQRYSHPSLRKYSSSADLPSVLGGLGTVIVSTPKGVMTDKSARDQGVGGEVLCIVT